MVRVEWFGAPGDSRESSWVSRRPAVRSSTVGSGRVLYELTDNILNNNSNFRPWIHVHALNAVKSLNCFIFQDVQIHSLSRAKSCVQFDRGSVTYLLRGWASEYSGVLMANGSDGRRKDRTLRLHSRASWRGGRTEGRVCAFQLWGHVEQRLEFLWFANEKWRWSNNGLLVSDSVSA